MDYFTLRNLKKEPFSNSPDPDFFFASGQHQDCLQKLELSILLRRGLNVVIGDVGTGKTTLSRQLIRLFDREEDNKIEAHLILDPNFTTTREFLLTISEALCPEEIQKDASERQIKEAIKNKLFDLGIDKKRIIALIIDEGQKLPVFCLEILREFLNYETNNYKLLQIVIFAQEEFNPVLKTRANFADRIATLYRLSHLSFAETREMIRFRLGQARGEQENPPDIFTFPALLIIFLLTRGYPRKIVMLCSKALISLIIQNRSKVTVNMVLDCAGELSGKKRVLPWKIAAALCLTAFLTLTFVRGSHLWISWKDSEKIQTDSNTIPQTSVKNGNGQTVVKGAVIPCLTAARTKKIPAAPSRNEDSPQVSASPELLGELKMEPGDSLSKMIARVYGRFNPENLRLVRAANPGLGDLNRIMAGSTIKFPWPRGITARGGPDKFKILVGKEDSLRDAYEFIKNYPAQVSPFQMMPAKNTESGATFMIFLDHTFDSREEAQNMLTRLDPYLQENAMIIEGRNSGPW